MRLKDKTILITGASSRMGRMETRVFAEQEVRIIAADIADGPLGRLAWTEGVV